MTKLIHVTRTDLEKIGDYLRHYNDEDYEYLMQELERARVISSADAPIDLVKMNTTLTYHNEQDDKLSTITLVYPPDANWTQGKISVLAPLGSALIGLRKGQSIYWTFPGGRKKLTVIDIHIHPEPQDQFPDITRFAA